MDKKNTTIIVVAFVLIVAVVYWLYYCRKVEGFINNDVVDRMTSHFKIKYRGTNTPVRNKNTKPKKETIKKSYKSNSRPRKAKKNNTPRIPITKPSEPITNEPGTTTPIITGQPPVTTVSTNPNPVTIPPTTSTIPSSEFPSADMWVSEHNRVRNDVGVKPLKWNDQLARDSLKHAKKCVFAHSPQSERTNGTTMHGENLAQGGPYDRYTEQMLFKLWENEKKDYTYPQGPGDSKTGVTGHYTQIINSNVTEVGCACINCNNNKYCVCRYNPIQYGGEPPY